MTGSELVRSEHAKRRLPTPTLVPDFKVFENRVGQLGARSPTACVQELDLHPSPERLDYAVVVAVPDQSHRRDQPESSARRVKALDVSWVLGSLWMIVSWGARASMVMPSALVTRAVVGEESMDQPTTRREKVSRTTAQ